MVRCGKQITAKGSFILDGIPELGSSHVGLVGFGSIAKETAKRLKPFGSKISYFNRSRKIEAEKELGMTYLSIEELYKQCDIISLHLPVTPETTGFYNKTLFAKLKKDGPLGKPFFINAGRGKSQNEDDLLAALTDGTLGGASLDVFAVEPLPQTSPLWALDNVVITPHAAAPSEPSALFAHVRREIDRYEAGETLQFTINRATGY